MNRNYPTAEQMNIPAADIRLWAADRRTDEAVAVGIHAIADSSRSAQDIWESPTDVEAQHVEMAVQDYVIHGDFDAGEFRWGEYRFVVSDGHE